MTGLVTDETLRTHARTIVEGEGAEEFSPGLVEAVADAIHREWQIWMERANDAAHFLTQRELDVIAARAALSTIRKHQAGE
jgi:prophage DNA circulation protein